MVPGLQVTSCLVLGAQWKRYISLPTTAHRLSLWPSHKVIGIHPYPDLEHNIPCPIAHLEQRFGFGKGHVGLA